MEEATVPVAGMKAHTSAQVREATKKNSIFIIV